MSGPTHDEPMPTALKFLSDLCKDLLAAEPMDRHIIVEGYAAHMEAREAKLRRAVMDEVDKFQKDNPGSVLGAKGYRKIAEAVAGGEQYPIYNVAGNSEMLGEV